MKENPNRLDVAFPAIENLYDPKDIVQFYHEYMEYIQKETDSEEVRQYPEVVATSNIRFVLEKWNPETRKLWAGIIQEENSKFF